MTTTIDASVAVYELWSVDVDLLANFVDPMADDVWDCGVITVEEVLNCPDISLGRKPSSMTNTKDRTREYHIARIAYLAAHGWDERTMEQIMLYTPENYYQLVSQFSPDDFSPAAIRNRQRLRITDGNHRFCAAVITGRKTLNVEPYGDVEYQRMLLSPVDAPLGL